MEGAGRAKPPREGTFTAHRARCSNKSNGRCANVTASSYLSNLVVRGCRTHLVLQPQPTLPKRGDEENRAGGWISANRPTYYSPAPSCKCEAVAIQHARARSGKMRSAQRALNGWSLGYRNVFVRFVTSVVRANSSRR